MGPHQRSNVLTIMGAMWRAIGK